MFKKYFLSLVIIISAIPGYSFYCGTKLIQRGDPIPKVLSACGKPTKISTIMKPSDIPCQVDDSNCIWRPVTDNRGHGTASIRVKLIPFEVWFYDFGPNYFTQSLTIIDDAVFSIKEGDYGKKTP